MDVSKHVYTCRQTDEVEDIDTCDTTTQLVWKEAK